MILTNTFFKSVFHKSFFKKKKKNLDSLLVFWFHLTLILNLPLAGLIAASVYPQEFGFTKQFYNLFFAF